MENFNNPAFPTQDNKFYYGGLTKREYFAGLAMQGLLSHVGTASWSAEKTAIESLSHADALLKELEK